MQPFLLYILLIITQKEKNVYIFCHTLDEVKSVSLSFFFAKQPISQLGRENLIRLKCDSFSKISSLKMDSTNDRRMVGWMDGEPESLLVYAFESYACVRAYVCRVWVRVWVCMCVHCMDCDGVKMCVYTVGLGAFAFMCACYWNHEENYWRRHFINLYIQYIHICIRTHTLCTLPFSSNSEVYVTYHVCLMSMRVYFVTIFYTKHMYTLTSRLESSTYIEPCILVCIVYTN